MGKLSLTGGGLAGCSGGASGGEDRWREPGNSNAFTRYAGGLSPSLFAVQPSAAQAAGTSSAQRSVASPAARARRAPAPRPRSMATRELNSDAGCLPGNQ